MWRQPLGCEAGDPGVSCERNNGVIESCHFEANSQNLGRTGSCAGNYCEAQGKERAKGQPRKVTKRSLIDLDGGWWLSFP